MSTGKSKAKPKNIDLTKLTKAEKLALLDTVEEKAKRRRASKEAFKPHPGQEMVIRSAALEKFLFCGNGFGKTTLLVNCMHWAATGYNPVTGIKTPVPAKIYLVLDDPGKMEQSIIPEYRKWYNLDDDQLSKRGKANYSYISFKNGSEIHVLTHEVNLLKLEGVEMTHLFFDEPPPRHVYVGLTRGGRIKGRPLEVMMAGTPLYQPWLRTQIYKRWVDGALPHVECFSGETDDNPHLEDEYKTRFFGNLTEQEKLTRRKGAFSDLSGQALAHLWEPAKHLFDTAELDWDQDNPCVIAMDPHPSKAHHAIILSVDRYGRYYVLDEFQKKSLARQFINDIIDKKGWFEFRVIDVVYDSLGSTDSTSGEGFKSFGDVVTEVMRDRGFGSARPTTFKEKSDEDFIERIRELLAVPEKPDNFGQQMPRLRVSEECRGTITDIEEVQWQRDRKSGENRDKLDISNTDFLACLKYALATNLFYKKNKQKAWVRTKGAYGFKSSAQRRLQKAAKDYMLKLKSGG